MNADRKTEVKASTKSSLTPVHTGLLQRKCACGGSPGVSGECENCSNSQLNLQRHSASHAKPSTAPSIVHAVPRSSGEPLDLRTRPFMEPRFGHDFGQMHMRPVGQDSDTESKPKDENEDGIVVVGQGGGGGGGAAATPDGNTLGPTDPTKRTCMPENRLIWVGGPDQNTATAATGKSRVTAHLGTAPGDGPDCDCNCGLFRQFIRGFWRTGTPTSPKRFDIGSCGNPIVMNESTWTEEFEACNPGGLPISADCDRTYLDGPGFAAGLSDGDFAELHLDLRYQMWDQCKGRSAAVGDRSLRISGARHPRTITFS